MQIESLDANVIAVAPQRDDMRSSVRVMSAEGQQRTCRVSRLFWDGRGEKVEF
jgi:hypothetical protein